MTGQRYKCATCEDVDLCKSCFERSSHPERHAFKRELPPRTDGRGFVLTAVMPLTGLEGFPVPSFAANNPLPLVQSLVRRPQ